MSEQTLRLGIPSKGSLAKDGMDLFANAGLKIHKPNARQYSATIKSLPGVEVFFQRPTDIFHKVQDGTVDIGVTGIDIAHEYAEADFDTICGQSSRSGDVVIARPLGFGAARLVVAVPESWLDVTSVTDLADLAMHYKEKGRKLRVATTFHNLTRKWLFRKGITNFTIVNAEGALEVAPSMGYADVIADLTATGTTLKENRLKEIQGGTILASEACLVCNAKNLSQSPQKLRLVKYILEYIEANLRAKKFVSVLANIQGTSQDEVGERLVNATDLSGMVGPSVVKVYSKLSDTSTWYEVNIVIERNKLLDTIEHLRDIGGKDITITYPQYVFNAESRTFNDLQSLLD